MNKLWLPLVAAQSRWVRRRTEMLPEASGPKSGVTPAGTADGEASTQVTVLGESTAAGCGAPDHRAGLPGALGAELHRRTGETVRWTSVGRHGATLRRVRHRLLPAVPENQDVVVLLAGVNDVLARRPVEDWREDLTATITELTTRSRLVVVTGVPAFTSFPALPRLLAHYLDEQATELDVRSSAICAETGAVWVASRGALAMPRDSFAADGFHPSPTGYRLWAELIADRLTA